MKKQILSVITVLTAMMAQAQQVSDAVSIGSAGENQVYYSLKNDEQKTAPLAEWDLAFDVKAITSSIHVNTAAGVKLWNYPLSDISGWGSVDISGVAGWDERNNSDEAWEVGAMGAYIDPNNPNDVDWGQYNPSNHQIYGDSIYILQLQNGNYKKLIIESLISGTFKFKYADIDGSNEVTATLKKGDYKSKNMGYYSIQNGMEVNREPDFDKWDLLFTRYTALIDMGGIVPYKVAGVLHNRIVEVAEAKNIGDVATYKNWYAHSFEQRINEIGYDWKSYNMSQAQYEVDDSLVYFVRSAETDIWKLVFTGYDNANGTFSFTKEKMVAAGIEGINGKKDVTVTLYPNPANGQAVNLLYNFEQNNTEAKVNVYDMSGKAVYTSQLEKAPGMHKHLIPTNTFAPGFYVISVDTDKGTVRQKLSVQ